MRPWLFALWLLVLLLLQVVFTPAIIPSGPRPDWLLVFAVLLGFSAGSSYGLAGGAVGGILLDIVTGRFIGLHALLKASLGWASGLITRHVYRDYPSIALLTVAAATCLQEVLAFLVLWSFGMPLQLTFIINQLPPLISYSLIAGALVYVILWPQVSDRRWSSMPGGPR